MPRPQGRPAGLAAVRAQLRSHVMVSRSETFAPSPMFEVDDIGIGINHDGDGLGIAFFSSFVDDDGIQDDGIWVTLSLPDAEALLAHLEVGVRELERRRIAGQGTRR